MLVLRTILGESRFGGLPIVDCRDLDVVIVATEMVPHALDSPVVVHMPVNEEEFPDPGLVERRAQVIEKTDHGIDANPESSGEIPMTLGDAHGDWRHDRNASVRGHPFRNLERLRRVCHQREMGAVLLDRAHRDDHHIAVIYELLDFFPRELLPENRRSLLPIELHRNLRVLICGPWPGPA